jgi:HSP20 family protein
VLSIQGMRRQDVEGNANKFHRVERSYGNFMRNFSLPDLVDDAKLEAVVKDGMLTLHLAKTEKGSWLHR